MHTKLIDAMNSEFYTQGREAVIQKWLTYAKNKYIDHVMKWRIRVLDCRLSIGESKVLQGRIIKNQTQQEFAKSRNDVSKVVKRV